MKALHINVGKSGQVVGALESFVTERLVGRTLDIPVGLTEFTLQSWVRVIPYWVVLLPLRAAISRRRYSPTLLRARQRPLIPLLECFGCGG